VDSSQQTNEYSLIHDLYNLPTGQFYLTRGVIVAQSLNSFILQDDTDAIVVVNESNATIKLGVFIELSGYLGIHYNVKAFTKNIVFSRLYTTPPELSQTTTFTNSDITNYSGTFLAKFALEGVIRIHNDFFTLDISSIKRLNLYYPFSIFNINQSNLTKTALIEGWLFGIDTANFDFYGLVTKSSLETPAINFNVVNENGKLIQYIPRSTMINYSLQTYPINTRITNLSVVQSENVNVNINNSAFSSNIVGEGFIEFKGYNSENIELRYTLNFIVYNENKNISDILKYTFNSFDINYLITTNDSTIRVQEDGYIKHNYEYTGVGKAIDDKYYDLSFDSQGNITNVLFNNSGMTQENYNAILYIDNSDLTIECIIEKPDSYDVIISLNYNYKLMQLFGYLFNYSPLNKVEIHLSSDYTILNYTAFTNLTSFDFLIQTSSEYYDFTPALNFVPFDFSTSSFMDNIIYISYYLNIELPNFPNLNREADYYELLMTIQDSTIEFVAYFQNVQDVYDAFLISCNELFTVDNPLEPTIFNCYSDILRLKVSLELNTIVFVFDKGGYI
jgi:hypothetical protein